MNESVNFDLFEKLLKDRHNNRRLKLYSDKKVDNAPKKTPQDVLKHVSSQLKAIQQADNVKYLKVDDALNVYKQSCFLSVNSLSVPTDVKKHNTKFETQCVSNTQLIELVENIEENVINTDMVEEFYASFDDISSEEGKHNEKKRSIGIGIMNNEDSQKQLKEDIISNTVTTNDCIKTNQLKGFRSRKFNLEENVSNKETYSEQSNIKQDVDSQNDMLHVINVGSAPTDSNCRRINNDDLDCKDIKDLDSAHSMNNVKPLKEVVFKSMDIYKPICDNEHDAKDFIIPDEEQIELEDAVNIPLSLILYDKKNNKVLQQNDRCSMIKNNDNAKQCEVNKETAKELYTHDYDSYSTDINKQIEGRMFVNVLKDKNSRINTKTILNKEKNVLKINEKENLTLIEELFTEDFNISHNMTENDKTISACSTLKKSIIQADTQELYGIYMDTSKTGDSGIRMKMKSNHHFKNKSDKIYTEESSLKVEERLEFEVDTQILEDFTLDTKKYELATQIHPSLVERKNIQKDVANHTKTSEDSCIEHHSKVVKPFSNSSQITEYDDDIKIQEFLTSHMKGKVEESISPKDKSYCIKKILKNKALTQVGTKSEANTTVEKENSDAGSTTDIDFLYSEKDIRPVSPTFNTKNMNKKAYKALVCDLKYFEKFENIAFPLIDSTKDMKVVKQIINSQILSNELYLCGNENKCLSDAENPLVVTEKGFSDDIFELNKNLVCKVDQEVDSPKLKVKVLSETKNNISNTEKNVFHNVKNSTRIEDEILFSSDEESEYIHKESKDLPLTYVLEKSFHNSSGVFENTMYVGFETASKKIIEISTDSYIKAQSILGVDVEGKSINELVSLVDNKSIRFNSNSDTILEISDDISYLKTSKQNDSYLKIFDDMTIKNENTTNDEKAITNPSETDSKAHAGGGENSVQNSNNCSSVKESLEKRPFEGFMTASNKRIKLSDIALAKCKKVFNDIDLDVDFPSNSPEKLKDIGDSLDWTNNTITKEFNLKRKSNDYVNNCTTHNDSKFTNKTKQCVQNFVDANVNNVENLTQVNITDELIIQEFENIDISLKQKEDNPNKSQNSGSLASKFETNDNTPFQMQLVGETEAFFEGLELTKIVDKYVESEYTHKLTKNGNSFSKKDDTQSCDFIVVENTNPPNCQNDSIKDSRQTTVLVDTKISKEMQFGGFKTAINKSIKISDNALVSSRKIFSDIEIGERQEFESNADIQLCKDMVPKNTKTTAMIHLPGLSGETVLNNEESLLKGFQTASNKLIKISEKLLKKSKSIFSDIDFVNTDINDNISESIEYNSKMNLHNDETFTYKANISEVALKNHNSILKHRDNSNEINKEITEPKVNSLQENNKRNTNSKNDPNKKKEILKNFNLPNKDRDLSTHDTKIPIPAFAGFQTANNKPVTISEEALKNCKDIFKDILFDPVINDNQSDLKKVEHSSFKGFQTANNGSVSVSNEALNSTKDLFKNIDIPKTFDDITGIDMEHDSKEISMFKGFQTASNKPVTISKDALKNCKDIFKDILFDPIINDNQSDLNKVGHSSFKGFQTANNKPVSLSNEALNSTKDNIDVAKTLDNIIGIDMKHNNSKEIPMFKGFQTANNKPVEISTEALLKSKNIFQDINFNEDFSVSATNINIENKSYKGFKTASNKNVTVSKQALEKCKNIFDDLNLTELREIDDQMSSQYTNEKEILLQKKSGSLHLENLKSNHKNNDFKVNNMSNISSHKSSELMILNKNSLSSDINVLNAENSVLKSKTKEYDKKNHINIVEKQNEPQKTTRSDDNIIVSKVNDVSLKKDAHCNVGHADDHLNTQLLNNFENTLHTEDFFTPPKTNRRSGSPILSCPKAKKRKKFEVPYRTGPFTKSILQVPSNLNTEKQEIYKFDNNYKKCKNYALKDLLEIEAEFKQNNTDYKSIKAFNHLEDIDLKAFKFIGERNDINDCSISLIEVKTIFENSVDMKIIPDNWFENHMKMILWKLFEYENKFPYSMKNVCRVTNVLEQLKYRYDVELYNAKRPALRRILEKDDVPSKLTILSVAGIYGDDIAIYSVTNPTSNIELLLTDGWYFVKASIDRMLATLVCTGKIVIGTKLATCGAELMNCEQGIPPWEDTSSIRLKLHGNSTRRARWDARLGYHANAAILSTLGSVKMDGGKVAKLRVYVTRVYPALYVEKFDDGSTVTRSERLENLHQMKFENERAVILEKLYEEVEKEIHNEDSQESEGTSGNSSKRRCLETGSQIAKTMKKCMDPMEFHNNLTPTQKKLLEEHTNRRREILLDDVQKRIKQKIETRGLCLNRNVIRLLKIRVAGVEDENGAVVTKGLLSIWKPNDAILDLIEEGIWLDVISVVPTALRLSEIHLSVGRQSIFKKHIPKNDSYKRHLGIYSRQSFTVSELVLLPSTMHNEIDTVGLVIDIEPNMQEFDVKKHTFQNVYLADENKNVVSLNFWRGLVKFGYENMFEIGQIVCCINLQKRLGNNRKTIPSYRVTEFSYFTKTPKYKNLRLVLDNLCKSMVGVDMKIFISECMLVKNKFASKVYSNKNISPFSSNCSDLQIKHNTIAQNSSANCKSDDFNLSGLDFDSTFKKSEEQDISPKLLQRKRQISKKIATLEMYGEPPPLNPVYIINKSKNAANNYKSPLLSKNDVSDTSSDVNMNDSDVGFRSKIKNKSIRCSFGLNRMRLKMEPIVLNFTKDESNISKIIDPFAEEFNESPPLSLDSIVQ